MAYPQSLGMPSPCSKHETAEDLEVLPHAANDQLDFFEAHPERSAHKHHVFNIVETCASTFVMEVASQG